MSESHSTININSNIKAFSAHMARVDHGIRSVGTCVRGEFYVLATVNANGIARKDYVMKASLAAIKRFAPMTGMTSAVILEWSIHTQRLMGLLNIEKVSVGSDIFVKPVLLNEGQFNNTQWCQLILRPTNAIYVDPAKLYIDINSIVEI